MWCMPKEVVPKNVEIERRFLLMGDKGRGLRIIRSNCITQWYLEADLFTASEATGSLSMTI